MEWVPYQDIVGVGWMWGICDAATRRKVAISLEQQGEGCLSLNHFNRYVWEDIRGAPRIRDRLGRREIRMEVRKGKLGVFHLVHFNDHRCHIDIGRLFVDARDRQEEEPRCDDGWRCADALGRALRHWHWTSAQWWMDRTSAT